MKHHEAKVASVKPRTEIFHSILDCIDILKVSFKLPFTVNFKLNGYKGELKTCVHPFLLFFL